MKKNKKKKIQHVNYVMVPILVTLLICAFLFTSGIVVWNYFAPKPVDIFVVHPIGTAPVPTPVGAQFIAPADPSPVEPAVPEEIPVGAQFIAPAVPEETPAPKPNFVEQSMMGWTIIFNVIKGPFTK